MQELTNYGELYPGRFIKAVDLGKNKTVLTIDRVVADSLEGDRGVERKVIVIFREIWGSRLTNPEIARAVLNVKGESWERTAADPSIFKHDGGPSIAEQLQQHGLDLAAADNSRVSGWSQVRQRLKQEAPLLYMFSTCPYLIECMQAIQHDEKHPEDLDTTGPDHILDAMRYAVMSRPIEFSYHESRPRDKMGKVTVSQYVKAVRAERAAPRV